MSRFFEIKKPYYFLIKAEDLDEATDKVFEVIHGTKTRSVEMIEVREMSFSEALDICQAVYMEYVEEMDYKGLKPVLISEFIGKDILLIDGSLNEQLK